MINVAIYGYGNLGRGVEDAIARSGDMRLVAVFTRRDPKSLRVQTPGLQVLPMEQLDAMTKQLDVLILCGGSATDLPKMTPALAAKCNVVDSFDNHSRIPEHIAKVHEAAKAAGKMAVVSCGWDPGLFSLARIYAQAALPRGESYTFWGPGLSQGHSDAVRRIPGVVDARQYTVPVEAALEQVRSGRAPQLTTRQKHTRHCYVVAEEGADLEEITRTICQMPGYFADYDTTVTFITSEEMARDHSTMPHGGFVIRSGITGENTRHTIEYSLKLESNPQFTASILVACARAAVRMQQRGESGCATIAEIRPCDLLMESIGDIRAHMI